MAFVKMIDGWWDEISDRKSGWDIESFSDLTDFEKRNDMESMYLLDTLEYSIAPMYYSNPRIDMNQNWIEKMKISIAKTSYEFNSHRMANDYLAMLYSPTAKYAAKLLSDNCDKLKKVVRWKQDIIDRFNTVKIKTILINGIKDGKISSDGLIQIKALLFSGKLKSQEIKVELILVKGAEQKFISSPIIIPLKLADSRESGILTYKAEYTIEDTGFYSYGLRVLPCNPELLRWQDAEVVYWG